jgi:hypothetical protein
MKFSDLLGPSEPSEPPEGRGENAQPPGDSADERRASPYRPNEGLGAVNVEQAEPEHPAEPDAEQTIAGLAPVDDDLLPPPRSRRR